MLWQSRRASSAWMLALIGRMLNASRVGVAVPGKPGALLYSEWADEGVDLADGAESARDDPRGARRALAAAVAVRDAPVQGGDLPRDRLEKAADTHQILGVPFPHHGGDRGALLLFRNADSAFEPLDVEAAVLLVDRLAGAATTSCLTDGVASPASCAGWTAPIACRRQAVVYRPQLGAHHGATCPTGKPG